ncbi:MAG: glycoside hydrolase family 65 protein, partial [Bacillota bacterium]
LQRYRVIKQADVLLLMTRMPQLFADEEKLAAWEDFEPICLHDSTLSFASHALFALQNGLKEQGLAYLRKALLLDLRDIMGNTANEGLHLACMGEAWQAARQIARK